MSIDERAVFIVTDEMTPSNALVARGIIEAYEAAKVSEQPVGWSLPSEKINDLQQASIERTVKRCKQAHFVDVRIRINGEYEYEEADWIKHMQKEAI